MVKLKDNVEIINNIRRDCGKSIKVFHKLEEEQPKTKANKSCPPFNLIQEFHPDNKKMYENAHTRVLGAILKYDGQFLRSFLERCCGMTVQKTKVYVDVERQYEKSADGLWSLKKNTGKPENSKLCRPDCLVWKEDQFAVIIENKINGASETSHQLDNYIDAVLSDPQVFPDQSKDNISKIWVLYLGGDTAEMPSVFSLSKGSPYLLRKDNQGNRSPGKHLCLACYKDVVIPWLEDDVLPRCPFGMTGLTGGLMVYIDYLKNRFENNTTAEERLFDSPTIVDFFIGNVEEIVAPFFYEKYIAVSNHINSANDNGKDLIFFKALRHFFLNYHFRFKDPSLNSLWSIRTTGAFVHMWKKSWESIQDKPHSTCDLFFEFFPYQIDSYLKNPRDYKKRTVTCCLRYKGKNDGFRAALDQELSLKEYEKLGEFVFDKGRQLNGNTLMLDTDGVFFDSFVKDKTIAGICSVIDSVMNTRAY